MTSAPANNPFTSSSRRPSFTPTTPISEMFPSVRPPAPYPGPITAAAYQVQQRRRMSVSGTTRPRGESISSISSSMSCNSDDSAVMEEEGNSPPSARSFNRRLSLGGVKMRDVRMPQVPTSATTSPVITRGFWLDQSARQADNGVADHHKRRQSLSSMPIPTSELPVAREMAAQKHDPLQERILKGDFYMD